MWLHEFGALGSVGGVMAEYRTGETAAGACFELRRRGAEILRGRLRGTRKKRRVGRTDGAHAPPRSRLCHDAEFNLTERSVLTTTNFIPIGKKFFMYQLAEYDLRARAAKAEGD
jgi:hypothetical protein